MGRTAEIEKVAMLVQVDGKTYQVVLSMDKMRLLVSLATSLSETGELPLTAAPGSISFEP